MKLISQILHPLRAGLGALAFAALAVQPIQAADFPPEQIRIVVPYSAGGGTDVIMRIVAKHMADSWKVNILIDNRVGAGGVVGSQYVTQQKPDGRTFLAVASAFAVRAAIDRTVPYDAVKDFSGVGQMAISPSFMVVSTSHGFASLKQLIDFAKKQPEGILYTSAGVGSTAHLHAAAVAYLAGIKAEHVPNKGTPQAVTEAMTGRVLYAFAPGPNAIPLARAGKLQILVTTSPAGARFLPGIPSIAQAGLKGYEGDDWFGVYGPAGMPLAMREKFSSEMARVLKLAEVRERLAGLGAEPAASSPQVFEKFAADYIARARKLAEAIGMKVQ
ncbi:MAG: tripartite tricarboxylate transporter substrate-binding protein [Betaproteobacteria bacterium]|jgi:tripartite-type tricarboxylate transporter receptor subunit TctC|nr:tripartite tricarboxylate transporter substrate-binding protein [Betaproteobacteria bacterium]MDH5343959.1 tripartite tricarboxylate transporter substrate-binding protein [Betaproteobacteria bacterium]